MEKFIRKIKCVIFGDYTKPLEEFSHDVKETKFDPSVPLTNLPETLKDLKFPKDI